MKTKRKERKNVRQMEQDWHHDDTDENVGIHYNALYPHVCF